MLAETPILERRTGTFAIEILAMPRQFRPVVFRACDFCQHAPWLDDKNLNLAVSMIGLAAREHFCPCKFAQDIDVEAWALFSLHRFGCRNGSVSIRCGACSSVTEECMRQYWPVCLCHITSHRASARFSSTWSSRVNVASNSSPSLSGKPDR